MAYALAMEIFVLSRQFPREELYSLTDQIRRAARSIAANIVEGWSKRHYPNIFKRHLLDSIGSCDETKLWLTVAQDCQYITANEHNSLASRYEQLSKMLYHLFENWKPYTRKQ